MDLGKSFGYPSLIIDIQWIDRDVLTHFLHATSCGYKKLFFLTNAWVFDINGSCKMIND